MIREGIKYIAIPPGETIKEMLEDREMSQKEFAKRMDMSEKHVCHLLNGDVELTNDTALKLEMVLGADAYIWLNLESIYRRDLIKVDLEKKMLKDIKVASKYPSNEIINLNWIEKGSTQNDLVVKIRKFFEVAELNLLDEYSLLPRYACNKANENYVPDYYLACWLQKSKLDSRNIETGKIDYKKIQSHAKGLKQFTLHEPIDFLNEIRDYLAPYGVAFIYLDRLSKLTIDGAAFIAGKKVVLSVAKGKKYVDEFFSVFFHELGHIILEHVKNPIDVGPEEEKDCEIYVDNLLIPKDKYQEFINNNTFTASAITDFSRMIGIERGLVITRLEKDKYIKEHEFDHLRRLMNI